MSSRSMPGPRAPAASHRAAPEVRLPESSSQQAGHDAEPEGQARASPVQAPNTKVVLENFRPDLMKKLGIELRESRRNQPAHRPWQHLRLRLGRSLSQGADFDAG